jgi:hypothetical protein
LELFLPHFILPGHQGFDPNPNIKNGSAYLVFQGDQYGISGELESLKKYR